MIDLFHMGLHRNVGLEVFLGWVFTLPFWIDNLRVVAYEEHLFDDICGLLHLHGKVMADYPTPIHDQLARVGTLWILGAIELSVPPPYQQQCHHWDLLSATLVSQLLVYSVDFLDEPLAGTHLHEQVGTLKYLSFNQRISSLQRYIRNSQQKYSL